MSLCVECEEERHFREFEELLATSFHIHRPHGNLEAHPLNTDAHSQMVPGQVYSRCNVSSERACSLGCWPCVRPPSPRASPSFDKPDFALSRFRLSSYSLYFSSAG